MTVVAGCLTPDTVFMGADCRLTWDQGGRDLFVDDAAKLVRLGPTCLIGYSGHVPTVAYLFGHLFGKQLASRRMDAASVSNWLPRFLRRTYRALARQYEIGLVSFLVGGSNPGREARIRFDVAEKTLGATEARDLSNWLMLRLMPVLPHRLETFVRPDGIIDMHAIHNAKPKDEYLLPGSSDGLLYSMTSPDFTPRFCDMLGAMAVGSGSDAEKALDVYRPVLMCGHPERAADLFVDAMINYLGDTRARGVGGMLLAAKVSHGAVRALTFSQEAIGEATLSVRQEGGRFIVSEPTGRQIPLRLPGEIVGEAAPAASLMFEGFQHLKRSNLPSTLQRERNMSEIRFKISTAEKEFLLERLRALTRIRETLAARGSENKPMCNDLQKTQDEMYHLIVGLKPMDEK